MSKLATTQSNILIIGQGAIGLKVTNKLAKNGYQVTGLARGKREKYKLHNDASYIQADALSLTSSQLDGFTHIAIIVTPDNYDAESYKNTYLSTAKHIAQLQQTLPQLNRVVFISSTGVYGQNNGEWIDESVPPSQPKREGSKFILQAEQALQQAFANKAIIIRPSGIYGKKRLMRITKAQEMDKEAIPDKAWTNRIMDTDLITIIVNTLTLKLDTLKPMYLATDYAPVTSYELSSWLSQQLGTTLPQKTSTNNMSGKRLHSNIPRGWLLYPDWQVGYKQILNSLP